MSDFNLYDGTLHLLDPVCFPHFLGKDEVPNFFDKIRYLWHNCDREEIEYIRTILKKRLASLKKTKKSALERCEITALIFVLKAQITNKCADWREAGEKFAELHYEFKNLCSEKCFFTKIAADKAGNNAEKCFYFASSF